jgi:predicted nucleotidyltransferase
MALEDHSYESSWWIDPETGAVEFWGDGSEGLPPEQRGWRCVDPVPSRDAYGDLEDFVARVADRRAADLLERAIAGRGAFRRFKDTLFEFPELRQAWFAFHDVRMRGRAIEWLVDAGLVDEEEARRELDTLQDPPAGGVGATDPMAVAHAVAKDLRDLYRARLHDVMVYGSWARGDAHPESDLDLLVVLADPVSPFEELRHMEEILWRHSLRSGLTVAATPVGMAEMSSPGRPVLVNARREGIHVLA